MTGRQQHGLCLDLEFAACNLNRTAATAGIGLAQFGVDQAHFVHILIAIADITQGTDHEIHGDTFKIQFFKLTRCDQHFLSRTPIRHTD